MDLPKAEIQVLVSIDRIDKEWGLAGDAIWQFPDQTQVIGAPRSSTGAPCHVA
ncbi:MAG TPA: hypothetical protein VMY41_04975 [Thermohalobaculum sp.]|nr:hypothetical protein [Thermohalobaculum sp.]